LDRDDQPGVSRAGNRHLEREHIRAERFELFVSDRKLSVDGGLAKHGLIMYQHVLLLLFLDRRLLA